MVKASARSGGGLFRRIRRGLVLPVQRFLAISAGLLAISAGEGSDSAGGKHRDGIAVPEPRVAEVCSSPLCERHGRTRLLPVQKMILQQLKQQSTMRRSFEACFAPGTPQSAVDAFYAQNVHLLQAQPFRPANRWTTTATDGGGIAQGTPITLTWGVVADGTPLDNGSPSNLRAFLNGIYGSQAVWLSLMQQVFDRWSELTGITYVFESNDDGASFPNSRGVVGTRPDMRIGGRTIDGPSNTLAFNYYPNTGDMVIDTADTFYNNTSNNSLRFRNVFSHEHGHGMGLAHTCPVDQTKLMEPFASTRFDGPQHDDILSANRNYSDAFGANNNAGTASNLGTLTDGSHSQTNLSLATSSDVDFYRFQTAAGSRKVTVTVSPVGLSYLEGAQNGDGSCSAGTTFNSRTMRNLSVEVIDSDGSTSLGVASSAGAGSDEVLANVDLGGGTGPFYVRVFGDAVNTVQMYALTLNVEDGTPQPEIGVFGKGVEIADGDTTPSTVDDTDFGSVLLGGAPVSRTFTITNSGTLDLSLNLPITISGAGSSEYTITQPGSATVSPQSSAIFQIIFNPGSAGTKSAVINIGNNDNTENPYTFAIEGVGVLVPEIEVLGNGNVVLDGSTTPSTGNGTDFGTVDVLAGSATGTFVVTNTGGATLTLGGTVSITGPDAGDFSVTAAPATSVAPGAGTSFSILFDPSTTGLKTATVSLTNNDSDENPYNFAIAGTSGSAPEIAVFGNGVSIANGDTTPTPADNTDFGSAGILSGLVARTFVITNQGSAPMTVGTPTIIGSHAADFRVTGSPAANVTPGSSTTFELTFDPSAVGSRSAIVTFSNSDGDENPFSFSVAGNGITIPDLGVAGFGVGIVDGDTTPSDSDGTDFGSSVLGVAGNTRTFVLTNAGSGPLVINLPVTILGSAAADFSITVSPAAALASGGVTSLEIQFTPGALGNRSATVSISSDDPDENPYTFVIQGQGTAAEIALLGGGLLIPDGDTTPAVADGTQFGSTDVAGGSVTHTFVITNSGDAVMDVTLPLTVSGPHASDFTVSRPPSATVAPGTGSSFDVVFNPSATGSRTATIEIVNSDGNESPYDFVINGIGTGPDIAVTGNGQPVPDGSTTPLVPNLTQFGTLLVGASRTNRFVITNTGSGQLQLSLPVTISGLDTNDFSIVAQPLTNSLVSGDSAFFDVRFLPTAGGVRTATVQLTNGDTDESPYDFLVAGQGDGPEISLLGAGVVVTNLDDTPTVVDGTAFGGADLLSGFVIRTFTITNSGTRTLNLTLPIGISGPGAGDFAVTVNPAATIPSGQSSSFKVKFDPVASGTRSATLSIASDDFDENPYQTQISGYGIVIPPTISIQPSSKNVNALQDTSLFVGANGTEPLTYRWYRNGTVVPGAGEPTLALNDVTALEGGSYFVTVSNEAGVVTSSTVQVTVNLLPTQVNWADPSPIVYGTALDSGVLNAGASAPGSIAYSPGLGSSLQAGDHTITASFTPSNPNVYRTATKQVTLTVNRAPLTIQAENKQRLVNTDDHLPFTFLYTGLVGAETALTALSTPATASTTASTGSPAGTYPITVSGATAANYEITFVNGTLRVFEAAPAIIQQPSAVTVDAFDTVTLTVVATGSGTLSYHWRKDGGSLGAADAPTLEIPAAQVSASGVYSVEVSNGEPTTATSTPVQVTVNPLTPVITWATPAPVVYGTLLGTGHLNATANTPGTFTYNPAAGHLFAAGNHSVTASFVPDDSLNYGPTSDTVTFSVTNAPLTVTATNQSREYNTANPTPLGVVLAGFVNGEDSSVLTVHPSVTTTADPASLPGTFPIIPSGTVAPNYTVTHVNGTLTVFAIPPGIDVQPSDASVVQGDTVSFSVTASGSDPLGYQWRHAGTNLPSANAATHTIAAATIGDGGTYDVVVSNVGGSVTSVVANLVVRIPPSITQQPVSQTVSAGANVSLTITAQGTIPLSYQWLSNGVAIAGANNAVLTLNNVSAANAAVYSVQVTNTAGSVSSQDATLTVNRSTPVVNWPTPAGIVYGSALGGAQLNATASVPGSFSYSPPAGSVPAAGTRTLSATFTPSDTGRHESVNATVSLLVAKAALTVRADNKSFQIGGTFPDFTATYTGFVNGETNTQLGTDVTLSSSGNASSPAGTYAIVATGAVSPNYDITHVNGTLTVEAVAPSITQQPVAVVVNEGGSGSFTVVADGSPPLAYQWKKGGVNVPGATGATLVFSNVQESEDGFYSVEVSNAAGSVPSSTVKLDVVEPTVISWASPTSITYGTPLSAAQLNASTVPAGTLTYTPPAGTVLDAGSRTLTVTFTPDNPNAHQPASTSVGLTVDAASLSITATNQTREYGRPNPDPLGVVYSGFVNGDTVGDLLSVPNVTTVADAQSLPGDYTITVAGGTAANYDISRHDGRLTVFANPPSVLQSPTNVTVTNGGALLLSVSADGTAPLSYQWRKDGVMLPGANAATYAAGTIDQGDAGAYDVVITNVGGMTTSSVASVTVVVPPGIVTQPVSQTFDALSDVTFSVVADGSAPLGYQWLKDGSPMPGENAATLTLNSVTSDDIGSYRVTVTNSAGSVDSADVTLAVNKVTPLLTWSQPFAVRYGTSLSPVQLNATASVGGTFNYTPTNGSILESGTHTLTVEFHPTDTNNFLSTTADVSLVVDKAPLTVKADDQRREYGAPNPALTISYTGFVNGETNTVLNTQPAASTSADVASIPGNYDITVSGATAENYTVSHVDGTLAVFADAPVVTGQPADVLTTNGGPAQLSVAVVGTQPLALQWRHAGTNLIGETAATLDIPVVDALLHAGGYDVVLSNLAGVVTSAVASVTILIPPAILQAPADQTVDALSSVGLPVVATGTPPLHYEWRRDGIIVETGNSPSLSLSAVTTNQAGSYTVTVSNAAGTVTSPAAVLTVNRLVSSLSWATPAVMTYGQALGGAQLNATATNAGVFVYTPPAATVLPVGTHTVAVVFTPSDTVNYLPGTGSISVQVTPAPLLVVAEDKSREYGSTNPPFTFRYQGFVNGEDESVLASFPTASTTADISSGLGEYPIVPAGGAADNYLLSPVNGRLTVFGNAPRITQHPSGVTGVVGGMISFTNIATGTAPLGYQWRRNGQPVPNGTNAVLTLTNLTLDRQGGYDVVVSNIAGSITSFAALLSVLEPPTLVLAPEARSAAVGENVLFQVIAEGTPSLGYQWVKEGLTLADQTNATLLLSAVDSNSIGNYAVIVTNVAGAVTSAPVSLSVSLAPRITQEPTDRAVSAGQAVNLSVSAAGQAPLIYQWSRNGSVLSGATNSFLTLTSVAGADLGLYRVRVSNASGTVDSRAALLSFVGPPQILTHPTNVVAMNGERVEFAVTASGSQPLQYTWFHNGQAVPGVNDRILSLTNVTATNAGRYQVFVFNSFGLQLSDYVDLALVESPRITQQPGDGLLVTGSTALLSVAVESVVEVFYHWRRDGVVIGGATNPVLGLTNVALGDGGGFDVVITNAVGSVTSRLASVSVAAPPVFIGEPGDAFAVSGAGITLTGLVTGTGPLFYQWSRNGSPVPGATNAMLGITNLMRTHQGNYRLTVTNQVGSISSSNALVRVESPVNLSAAGSARLSNGRFRLFFGDTVGGGLKQSDAGRFSVEASDNLRDWVIVSTNGVGLVITNGQFRFEDIGAIVRSFRYYRVLEH